MSLSRHFDRHYPTRKSYLLGLDEEKARKIADGEKKIEEDLKWHPKFKKELEGDHTIYDYDENGEYREYTKNGREIYIFRHGYCQTGARFCKMISPLHIMDGHGATEEMRTEIFKINQGLVSDWMDQKKMKLLEASLECTQCQAFYNGVISEGLVLVLLQNLYGIIMSSEDFRELLFNADFKYEDLEKELKQKASEG